MTILTFVQRFITQPLIKKVNEFFDDVDHFIFKEFTSFQEELFSLSTFKTILIFMFMIKWVDVFLTIFVLTALRWVYLLWKLRRPLKPNLTIRSLEPPTT